VDRRCHNYLLLAFGFWEDFTLFLLVSPNQRNTTGLDETCKIKLTWVLG
jgi:hypothetical protein